MNNSLEVMVSIIVLLLLILSVLVTYSDVICDVTIESRVNSIMYQVVCDSILLYEDPEPDPDEDVS